MREILIIFSIFLYSLTVISCGSSSGGGSSTTSTTGDYSLEGTLTYDYVPATSSYDALDYNNITTKPIR